MDIHFETTGCRLNQIESESAARLFTDNKFSVSLNPLSAKSQKDESACLCVINTCAVTQKAEQKDRRIIRLALEKLPNACLVVTGCYAQLSKDEINAMDKRIACLPGQIKNRISVVSEVLRKSVSENSFDAKDFADYLRRDVFSFPPEKKGFSEDAFKLSTDSFLNHSRASIKIQDGCNCACSYCAIRIARGHSVSLDAETILERIKKLEETGQNEVVFTTVNIGQYKGFYKGDYLDFPHLLKLCLKSTSRISFRISSLYPEIVDDYFAEVIKDKRVRPHFHISVQSGSGRILKAMGRSYSPEDIVSACSLLKKSKENPFLACDIITGFPGESDEDFEKTMDLCRKCGFSWIHVFPFSARSGTLAAKMKNQIPQSIRGERAKRLSLWAAESKRKYIDLCKGKKLNAILENVKKTVFYSESECESEGFEIFHAVTENFLHCEIKASRKYSRKNALRQGMSVDIRIIRALDEGAVKGGEIECLAEFV